MKIVNPLYDIAFKYLMENNKLAKKVLSVILDTEVVELSLSQQETAFIDEKHRLSLFRLDFKAVIKNTEGEKQKVLIELQKSKFSTDIQRFRTYLGSNYMKRDEDEKQKIVAEKNIEYKSSLPIIAVFILGYNLDDLPYLAVTVNRDIFNSINKKKIKVKSFFVEQLTHKAHILQIRRLPEKRRTRLENFLTLFNQAWCTEQQFILDLQDINEEFKDIARYLQAPVMDEGFHRRLMAEEEIDFIFDEQETKFLRKIADAEKQIEDAERQIEDAERQIEKNERQIEKEKRLREQERELKKTALLKLAILMKKSGAKTEKIEKETGLPKRKIEKL